MGKRSDFARIPKDKYRTPPEAVAPLLRHLTPRTQFIEPCAGDGRLADHLEAKGHRCLARYDLDPERFDVQLRDATRLRWPRPGSAVWITNPPWTRDLMHPIMRNLIRWAPTWLLFDADWAHNSTQYPEFRPYCRKIVSVGRVVWIEGTDISSKDNCSWYLFEPEWRDDHPVFFGPT